MLNGSMVSLLVQKLKRLNFKFWYRPLEWNVICLIEMLYDLYDQFSNSIGSVDVNRNTQLGSVAAQYMIFLIM